MKVSMYDKKFFSERYSSTNRSAKFIVSYLDDLLPEFESIVDIGCADGIWLKNWLEKGKQITGVDGNTLDASELLIPSTSFTQSDLSEILPDLGKRFDVCMSLEVAEHLPLEQADKFVDYLCSLSDVIIFSAAVAQQGGFGHVNEQWQGYWARKFLIRNYAPFDFIRPYISEQGDIAMWYRQNMIIYINKNNQSYINDLVSKYFNKYNTDVFSARCKDVLKIPDKEELYASIKTWRLVEMLFKRIVCPKKS